MRFTEMVPITSTNPASEHEKKQFDPNLVFIANFLTPQLVA